MIASSSTLFIRDAEINGRPGLDCRVAAGSVTEIGPNLEPAPHDTVLEGRGGALVPGLADHHIHLTALAAWRASADLTDVPPRELPSALRSAEPDAAGWVRAVGYDDVLHGDLDRTVLDAWLPATPLRVQHRSGALWILNSAALALTSAESSDHPGIEREPSGRASGRIWRADGWLRDRVPGSPPHLRELGHELASYGITHVSDASPDPGGAGARLLAEAVREGDLPQHVAIMSPAVPRTSHPRLTAGPVKLIVPDHEPPDLDELTSGIRDAHATGRPVAVHCVTRQAVALTLAALDEAGNRDGDRVEHCAVADLATARALAERRIRVVTQPTLLTRRGDSYRHRIDSADQSDLWRYATLHRVGVLVAPSSDAPYGNPDPWAGIRAAAERRTPSGHVLGSGERVPAALVLAGLHTELDDPGGVPRIVQVGAAADLTLLDRPLAVALRDCDSRCVAVTIVMGKPVYRRADR